MTRLPGGIISFRVSEGERIGKGALAAVIYTGTVSQEVQNSLTSINERIRDLESSTSEQVLYAGDEVTTISQVVGRIDDVIGAVYSRDTAAVTQYKDDITRLIGNDQSETTALTTLEQLRAEKQQLEASIAGNAVSLYAPEAGVMSSVIDGYESYFQYQQAAELPPSYLDAAEELAPAADGGIVQGQPCLKIVDNYSWYYAANVDERWVKNLKEGDAVSLRFINITEDKIDGTVYHVSEPENGSVTVVVESDQYVPGIYSIRETEAELIRKSYTGFKISKKALRIDEQDQAYVLINSEGVVRRRDVTVLFSDEAYVIIQEDNSDLPTRCCCMTR